MDYLLSYGVVTTNHYLKLGVSALLQFHSQMNSSKLVVLDSTFFSSAQEIYRHLHFIKKKNAHVKVIVINEYMAEDSTGNLYCPWVFRRIDIKLLKWCLSHIEHYQTSLEETIYFYSEVLKRTHLNDKQERIIHFLMEGLSVRKTSQLTSTPSKTIYSILRAICAYHNQKATYHLIHLLQKQKQNITHKPNPDG